MDCCQKPQEEDKNPWKAQVRVSEAVENSNGLDNGISTTKYSFLTWLPISILEQFRRVANVYFLVLSVLILIGTYVPEAYKTPLEVQSVLGPLVMVLLITSAKEGVEDWARYTADREENLREVITVTFDEEGKEVLTTKKTHELKTGDIIKMEGRTIVPADVALVLTSNHEDGNQCYIETANIDGETNLKVREAPSALKSLLDDTGSISPQLVTGFLEFEPPNKNIHNFVGAFTVDSLSDPIALTPENVIYRSSIFSNTDWGYAIVVYAGKETKVQMNNRKVPSKVSKVEGYANTAIVWIFILQCVTVSFAVIGLYAQYFQRISEFPYIYKDNKVNAQGEYILERSVVLPMWLEQWFCLFILYNNFIPISLYVTLEMVDLGQAYMISSDKHIYDEDLDAATTVKSSNMCQELGLISNIFSDKTGTLTRNEMKFVTFVVNGKMYEIPYPDGSKHGNSIGDAEHEGGDSNGIDLDEVEIRVYTRKKSESESNENGRSRRSKKERSKSIHPEKHQIQKLSGTLEQDFVKCLTVCHTVVRESDGSYRAESPDELALVEGVAPYGCGLLERGTTSMICNLFGTQLTYEILAVNAFNSDRKRMSILLRDPKTREHFLYCKGADSVMLGLCKLSASQTEEVDKSLLDLARVGLRTLVVAMRRISSSQADTWAKKWREAATSLQDRAEKVAAVGSEMEIEMDFLGITAIEDRLQDQVPEVLAELAKAQVTLWMCTGDKEETAINIGRSCNLLESETKLFYLTKTDIKDETTFSEKLKEVHYELIGGYNKEGGGWAAKGSGDERVEVALVLDGPSFKFYNENDEEQRMRLLKIGQCCRSVIACRLTPSMKQALVTLVKNDTVPRAVCLAIGDGANDVSMIMEADVGVGIIGKEGRQAANNADFAIGQFKFLKRLLLVHGRWNYVRQSKVFLYSMYKNMVITLVLFCFTFFNACSGQALFESNIYTGFNAFLLVPILVYGVFDRDVTAKYASNNPEIYSTGRNNRLLSPWAIGLWVFNAGVMAALFCMIYFVALADTYDSQGIFDYGTAVYVSLIMGLQAKVSFLYNQWNYINASVMICSILLFYIWVFVNSSWVSMEYYEVARHTFSQPLCWLFSTFTFPILFYLVDLLGQGWYIFFAPTPELVYRERSLVEDGKIERSLMYGFVPMLKKLYENAGSKRGREGLQEANEQI